MTDAYWIAKYEAWIQKCPLAYPLFRQFASEVKAYGHKHFSAASIVYRMRYEFAVGRFEGKQFPINQNYAKYLGHELMRREPEFAGFFRTRGPTR